MEEEKKKAAAKAMRLLLQQDRTRKNLMERLLRAGFSEEACEYALQYVESFGYVDDLRYARTYVEYHKDSCSRKELQYKLMNRGVPEELLDEVFSEYNDEDEYQALLHLMEKKLKGKNPAGMERREREKLMAYLVRKGYALSSVKKAMEKLSEL